MKQENYVKGMVMIILSAFFFACMNVSVRLAGDLPSVQKSFFRNLVAAFCGYYPGKKSCCAEGTESILGSADHAMYIWNSGNPV